MTKSMLGELNSIVPCHVIIENWRHMDKLLIGKWFYNSYYSMEPLIFALVFDMVIVMNQTVMVHGYKLNSRLFFN